MPIQANVTNNQITASVGETQIDVNVSGGVGPTGNAGAAATVTVGTVTTGAPGSSASVVNAGSSSAAVLNFTIPAGATGATGATGPQGATGAPGAAATVSVGTVTTGAANSSASVTNSGSSSAAVLNFTIPAGSTGPQGPQGPAGSNATATTDASQLVSGTLPDARLSANIARTSDVSSAVAALVNSAPATLDTLAELASALGSDANFSTTVTNALAAKAPINNPTFTGTVSGITKGMVGLGNVDNTSDASKPVSTAQAAADAAVASAAAADATSKANAAQAAAVQRANHTGTQAIGTVDGLQTALDGKAAVSHAHSALTDITGLATVATSGSAADLSGTLNAARLPATTVTAGSYGSASSVATYTVDAAGRLTAAGSTAIAISAGAVSGLAAVATSGAYSSLTGTPTTLPPTAGSVTDASITSGGLSASSINWAAIQSWAANTAYAKGDLVSNAGIAYRRSATGTSGATFNVANWQQITPSEFVASQITSGTLAESRLPSTAITASYYQGYDGIADANDWATRVTTAGGSVSTATMNAVYKFCVSISAAGLRERFYRLNLFCGSNLTTALVPLYRGLTLAGTQFGNTTDTNVNFVSGDYSESTGLIGNGSNKYLDTGFNVSNLTLSSRHLSFCESQKPTVQWSSPLGVTASSYYFRYDWETASGATYGTYAAYLDSSASGSCKDVYYAQNSAHFIATNTAALIWNMYKGGESVKGIVFGLMNTTANPSATLTIFCNRNGASGTNNFWNGRMAAYSVGLGMTGGQAAAYANALAEFNRALGRVV